MSHTATDHSRATASADRSVDVHRHPRTFAEAKGGFKTSEFYVMVAFVVAVLFATYVNADSLGREDGWRFAAFAVALNITGEPLAPLSVA